MFYISEISTKKSIEFKTDLQKKVYESLEELNISYERTDTDEAISMNDCTLINEKLGINMVKTLFLCNSPQTEFFMFVTKDAKLKRLQFFKRKAYHALCDMPVSIIRIFWNRCIYRCLTPGCHVVYVSKASCTHPGFHTLQSMSRALLRDIP